MSTGKNKAMWWKNCHFFYITLLAKNKGKKMNGHEAVHWTNNVCKNHFSFGVNPFSSSPAEVMWIVLEKWHHKPVGLQRGVASWPHLWPQSLD